MAPHRSRSVRAGTSAGLGAHRAAVAVVVSALVLAGCTAEEAPTFGTAEVTVEAVTQVISSPATVVARTYAASVEAGSRADLVAPGVASIAQLSVADGETVTAGQQLAVLRSDSLSLALRQAEAGLASARAAASSASAGLARLEERVPVQPLQFESRESEIGALLNNLRDEIAIYEAAPKVDYRERELRLTGLRLEEQRLLAELDQLLAQRAQVRTATASVAQAELALAQARRAVADLTLTAPFDGVVTLATDLLAGGRQPIGVGADVAPNQAVMTVVGDEAFRVQLVVPEADLAPLTLGGRAAIDLEAFPGTPVTGAVRRIDLTEQRGAAGTTYSAEVALDAGHGLALRPGLTGTATLPALAFAERFEVVLEVDEIDVVLVEVGQRVVVEVDAVRDQPLEGTVVALSQTAQRQATGGTVYRARVRLDEPAAGGELPRLRGGLTGTADVEVQRIEGAVTVPTTALLRSGGSEVVYVVRGGVAVEVPVVVRAFGEARAAVVGELEAGERVVTTGVERVEPGVTVDAAGS
jgi:multidrug efflux pump subunit AcrA (membrane-fusion protein)